MQILIAVALMMAPQEAVDDHAFLRRVTLDVAGRLPRPEEIRAFVKSPDREKKIDDLLASDEAAEFFADTWLRLLLNYTFDETLPLKINFPAFRAWLKEAWAKDVSYRDFAVQLLSDHGDYKQKPASNFLLAALDPVEPPHEVTNRVTRIFLGIQMQCARCHDDPFQKHTQEDFWGLTAFFNGIKPKARTTFDGFGVKLMMDGAPGVMKIPDSTTEVAPRFPDGSRPEAGRPPLQALAAWVTGHPQFARAIVSRHWTHFMGRPPENLEPLVEEFTRNGMRLRPLARAILVSKGYQAVGAPLKPLTPVQVLNTLTYVLNMGPFLDQFYKTFADNKDLPETYRNPEVFRMFLHLYMQGLLAPSGIAPEQTKYTGSVRLALKLMNSNDLQGLVKAEWGRLADLLKREESPEKRLEEIFLTIVSRPPTADERERYLAYLEKKRNVKTAYEDVYWVLLNSTEMIFNH